MVSTINYILLKINNYKFILSFIAVIVFIITSCNDTKIDKLNLHNKNNHFLFSDSIPIVDIIGKWSLKEANNNAHFKSFIIDSNGFHNITDTNIWHYKLSIEGNKLILGIDRSQNLITSFATDTLTIYWNSGQYETYIRNSRN
jgi:hypothetical protein